MYMHDMYMFSSTPTGLLHGPTTKSSQRSRFRLHQKQEPKTFKARFWLFWLLLCERPIQKFNVIKPTHYMGTYLKHSIIITAIVVCTESSHCEYSTRCILIRCTLVLCKQRITIALRCQNSQCCCFFIFCSCVHFPNFLCFHPRPTTEAGRTSRFVHNLGGLFFGQGVQEPARRGWGEGRVRGEWARGTACHTVG